MTNIQLFAESFVNQIFLNISMAKISLRRMTFIQVDHCYVCDQDNRITKEVTPDNIQIVFNPEFLTERNAVEDYNNQKRIIENEIRFLVLSFTSDWLFPTKESREIVSLLNSIGSNVSFAEVVSDRGHDSFLLDEPQFFRVCEGFLKGIK